MLSIFPLVSFKICNRFIHIYLASLSVAPDEEGFLSCLTEILNINLWPYGQPFNWFYSLFFTADRNSLNQDPA